MYTEARPHTQPLKEHDNDIPSKRAHQKESEAPQNWQKRKCADARPQQNGQKFSCLWVPWSWGTPLLCCFFARSMRLPRPRPRRLGLGSCPGWGALGTDAATGWYASRGSGASMAMLGMGMTAPAACASPGAGAIAGIAPCTITGASIGAGIVAPGCGQCESSGYSGPQCEPKDPPVTNLHHGWGSGSSTSESDSLVSSWVTAGKTTWRGAPAPAAPRLL
mmetsp:Transcript_87928/g.249085  ORF Transcript_87928/g.249085 Transcript_87928/m.249085 type:complete len:220 (-) Transcript_87928:306-965(-)